MWEPPDRDAFFKIVWDIVAQIPEGQVSTYGQIASMLRPPEDVPLMQFRRLAPRWVGRAMNACPPGVPWQRVINSQGMVSLPHGSPARDQQIQMLKAEGVAFNDAGHVDLGVFGWDGPSSDWLESRRLLPPKPFRNPSTGDDQPQLRLF